MLSKLEKYLVFIEKIIMVVTSIALVLLVCWAVVLRYILQLDLYGIEEIEVLIGFWLYFVAGVYGSYKGTQISADILNVLVKNMRVKRFFNIVANIVAFLMVSVFAYWSWDLLMFSIQKRPVTAVWRIPMFYTYLPVVLGFILMAVYAFRDLCRSIKGAPVEE